ncbi:MAG: DUF5320 domain-containing protein [Methanolinea sp.]|nr:MAG: DUF5320 domain-containing protein [Methanolinea sp.]
MPGFDRTGPLGRGPMTGWGRGWCATGRLPVPQQGTTPQAAGTEPQEQAPDQSQLPPAWPAWGPGPAVYGRGRGGIPWGCGRGFGGGRRGGRFGGWCWRY